MTRSALTSSASIIAAAPDVSWEYAKAFRHLQKNGQLIGANDLWIAAAAVAYGMPLVTANHKEFIRVPGLASASTDRPGCC